MLSKLLKYEYRQTARFFLPVFGGVFCLAGITALVIQFAKGIPNVRLQVILTGVGAVAFVMWILAMYALVVMSVGIGVVRFYRMLGDDGYTMFTLPVSPMQLVWSKLIAAASWLGATLLALVVCTGVMVFTQAENVRTLFTAWEAELIPAQGYIWPLLGILPVFFVVASVFTFGQFYLSCLLGSKYHPKNRLLGSVAAYALLVLVIGVFQMVSVLAAASVVTYALPQLLMPLSANPWLAMIVIFSCFALWMAVVSAVLFAVIRRLVTCQINLA